MYKYQDIILVTLLHSKLLPKLCLGTVPTLYVLRLCNFALDFCTTRNLENMEHVRSGSPFRYDFTHGNGKKSSEETAGTAERAERAETRSLWSLATYVVLRLEHYVYEGLEDSSFSYGHVNPVSRCLKWRFALASLKWKMKSEKWDWKLRYDVWRRVRVLCVGATHVYYCYYCCCYCYIFYCYCHYYWCCDYRRMNAVSFICTFAYTVLFIEHTTCGIHLQCIYMRMVLGISMLFMSVVISL